MGVQKLPTSPSIRKEKLKHRFFSCWQQYVTNRQSYMWTDVKGWQRKVQPDIMVWSVCMLLSLLQYTVPIVTGTVARWATLMHYGFIVDAVAAVEKEVYYMIEEIRLGTKSGFKSMPKTLRGRTTTTTHNTTGIKFTPHIHAITYTLPRQWL